MVKDVDLSEILDRELGDGSESESNIDSCIYKTHLNVFKSLRLFPQQRCVDGWDRKALDHGS